MTSEYLTQDPRTVEEAMRMILETPAQYSAFSPRVRQWVKAEMNKRAGQRLERAA